MRTNIAPGRGNRRRVSSRSAAAAGVHVSIMTDDLPAVTSDEEFEETLTHLITNAYNNGVAVEGPWLCRNGDETASWEAVVIELDEAD